MCSNMKKILYIIFSVFCLFNCSKSEPQVNNDEYYAKYVIQFSKNSIHMDQARITFTFTDEHLKTQVKNYVGTSGEDEIVCGPFKLGDKIVASCDLSASIPYTYFVELLISKNNSPFALKKTKSSSSQEPYTTLLEYIIDY